ncbi:host cell division inhibitor Icd-like protein [Xenorhabdus japonica]|uniref:Ash protein family protein n=1 Tax=Xenorhabdus japonica TaxID=53341 RepID=A0A1I5AXV4_9GAMM|nr:host cell division inhibitor Icd-like protein [Xenorhabdus japonica]SFN67268.1 Ash protein family protein [Xenorhabdus japonica]
MEHLKSGLSATGQTRSKNSQNGISELSNIDNLSYPNSDSAKSLHGSTSLLQMAIFQSLIPPFWGIKTHSHENSDHCLFTLSFNFGYIDLAPAKSGVRIETLSKQLSATHDAPSVFFCVTAPQHLPFKVVFAYTYSMVALSRQLSSWLVPDNASSLNLVCVTAPIEIETSRGDSSNLLSEIATMATIPTPTHFKFVFLSIKRADLDAIPSRIEAIAADEHNARSALSRDFVLFFAARLPVQEVRHV